jgi:hypothetical protein
VRKIEKATETKLEAGRTQDFKCFSQALKHKYFPLAVNRLEELEAQLVTGNIPCNCAKEAYTMLTPIIPVEKKCERASRGKHLSE